MQQESEIQHCILRMRTWKDGNYMRMRPDDICETSGKSSIRNRCSVVFLWFFHLGRVNKSDWTERESPFYANICDLCANVFTDLRLYAHTFCTVCLMWLITSSVHCACPAECKWCIMETWATRSGWTFTHQVIKTKILHFRRILLPTLLKFSILFIPCWYFA